MGASLLVRTMRAVTVTDAGAEFLARIEPILADLDEAEHAARHSGGLRGSLRGDLMLDDDRQDLVKEEALVQVLPDWDMGSVDVHAIFTNGRSAKPSARASSNTSR